MSTTSRTEKGWIGVTEAMEFLGVPRREVEELARLGRIRVVVTPGSQRGRRYSVADMRLIIEDRESTPDYPLYSEDQSLNLNGRVPDWVSHTFVDRLDSCWTFLMAHAYLDKEWSEQVRDRIVADIQRSGQRRRFLACNALSHNTEE